MKIIQISDSIPLMKELKNNLLEKSLKGSLKNNKLEIGLITEVNMILNQIKNVDLTIEAFSCKYTKKQRKMIQSIQSHLQNILILSNLIQKDKKNLKFKIIQFNQIKNEIFLILMRSKVTDAEKIIRIIQICIENSIGLHYTQIYSFENRYAIMSENNNSYLCFLFYNKRIKKVVLLTLFYNLNQKFVKNHELPFE